LTKVTSEGLRKAGNAGAGRIKHPSRSRCRGLCGDTPWYAKMEIMKDIKSGTLAGFAERNIEEGSVINSDAYRSYMKAFGDSVFTHNPSCFDSFIENFLASSFNISIVKSFTKLTIKEFYHFVNKPRGKISHNVLGLRRFLWRNRALR
jgi:hypothetical protein